MRAVERVVERRHPGESWAARWSALQPRLGAVARAVPAIHDRSLLLTVLAVLGVLSGLGIAALLSQHPREAGAYAIACVMLGGSMAIGVRSRDARTATSGPAAGTATPTVDVVDVVDAVDAVEEARAHVRAAAHDLRAPLLTVSSYLQLIADGAFGPVSEEARAAIRRTAEVSDRAQALVDAALARDAAYAVRRPAEGYDAPVFTTRVDLNRTLSDVLAALTSEMRQRSATVAVEGRLHAVRGEDVALFRVLENLVQNSIKFCPADRTPRLVLRSRRLDALTVEVCLQDNGAGMPSDAARLSTPGERGANAGDVQGHGLGMATVTRLIARMEGSVHWESPTGGSTDGSTGGSTDGGTLVRITLPAA